MGLTNIPELLRRSAVPIGGAERGFNERADTVLQAADGTDLNDFWDEIRATLNIRNTERSNIVDFLTFRTTDVVDSVSVPTEGDFEEASEYGQPVGLRTTTNGTTLWRGYDFKFYDLAIRYTWMAIAEMDRRQLQNHHDTALGADNRLIFKKVMKTLFNSLNLNGVTDNNMPVQVKKFYNGDGEVPPAYSTYTHTGTHNHYLTTQGVAGVATLTAAGVDAMELHLAHHGFAYTDGYRYVLWVNRQEANIIKTWKVANGQTWDFIPDQVNYGGGVYIPTEVTTRLVGQPQGQLPGQIGTYGPWHVLQNDYVPAGYVTGLVSGGPDNISNPIGLREHVNPAYRGLVIEPGQRSQYPLIDSFYRRGFGTGIRQRGAGVVMQVTANATYTIPALYA